MAPSQAVVRVEVIVAGAHPRENVQPTLNDPVRAGGTAVKRRIRTGFWLRRSPFKPPHWQGRLRRCNMRIMDLSKCASNNLTATFVAP